MIDAATRAGRSTGVAAFALALGCTASVPGHDPASPPPKPPTVVIASIPEAMGTPAQQGPSATSRAARVSAPDRHRAARELYLRAREQHRTGDRANARRNFRAAIELGFAPRLFEDTPQQYLARMDREEEAASQPTLSPFQQFFWNMGLRPVPPDEAAEGGQKAEQPRPFIGTTQPRSDSR